jgi:hypothetical protein
MNAMTVLEVELIGTAVAGLVFLALYMRRATRSALRDAHPGVRGAAQHIVAVTVVAVGETGTLALLGLGVPIPVPVILAGYGLGFLVVLHRIYLLLRGKVSPPMNIRQWLKADARNRAWRTLLQFVGAVVIVPAGDAVLQVVSRAVVDSMAGKAFSWAEVGTAAKFGAAYAVTVAMLAYLHRAKLDPSPIPSATPPPPLPSHVVADDRMLREDERPGGL